MNNAQSGEEESFEVFVQKLREAFREEAYELLSDLEISLLELEKTPQDRDLVGRVFRALHTMKGSGGSCGLDDIAAFAHEIETFFDQLRKGKISVTREIISLSLEARDCIKDMLDAHYLGGTSHNGRSEQTLVSFRRLISAGSGSDEAAPVRSPKEPHRTHARHNGAESRSSIRVATGRLDTLVNLVGELVTVQAQLSQTALAHGIPQFLSIAEEMERLTLSLRDNAMSIRMLPIGTIFSKFRRVVRDLSAELGKEIELTAEGADTELDKTVIERLSDPLVHLIRNCVDHGIEKPQAREAAGKPRCGTVHLSAVHSGSYVLIQIRDDGAGLDPDAIRAKALEKGLVAADARPTDHELYQLIFMPDFSTATKVSSVSGRGVGLDVVKKAIDALRGTVEISSERGRGATITLKLPLTLAIIDGLLTKIGQEYFIFPLSMIEECIELKRDDAKATERRLIDVRGHLVPYISLRSQFMIPGTTPPIEQVLIAEVDGRRVGFVVDAVIGGHQTVLKSLGRCYKDVEGISGATILGDGAVALMLDIPRLVSFSEQADTRRSIGAGVPANC